MNKKRTTPALSLEKRYDSMIGASTGRGGERDKVKNLAPNPHFAAPFTMRNWYRSNGFIENMIDAPAEDAVREWITLTTNRDEDNEKNGLPGLGISRLILNRMDDLKIRGKVRDLIRFSRMYSRGGFLYAGVKSAKPQDYKELAFAIPEIESIDFINVFGPDQVSIRDAGASPISKYYHKLAYNIAGVDIHESRLYHLVRKYLPEERDGISVISTILDAAKAQDTALWSVTTLVYEMAVWVFKSEGCHNMTSDTLAETLVHIKSVMSTQGFMGIGKDEELQRIVGTDAGKGFLGEAFNFIMENLAGVGQMPKSRLMGQAQGTITSGQFDLLGYYDTIAKFQEAEVREVLYWIINLILRETKGEIYAALGGDIKSLDWEITFNPLWREDPNEKAERELKESQRDQIYITTGVLSPAEVKQLRFAELEQYGGWEDSPLDFRAPRLAEPDDDDGEDDEDEKQKNKIKTNVPA